MSGIIVPVEVASESAVFRLWGVDSVGVSSSLPTDAVREGIRRETALVEHGPHHRATNIPFGLPNCRGGKELSHRGVLGSFSNADGDTVPLYTSTCPGHLDHTVGGKPPPPKMPPA